MKLDTATIAQISNGNLAGNAENVICNGVSIDTRSLQPGNLFVALPGEKVDGHEFVDTAIQQGAAAVLVTRVCSADIPQIIVQDTQQALGSIAANWRGQFHLPVIGITGSNGKTTCSQLLASVLRQHYDDAEVLVTKGNFNNELGVPLTLCRLNSEHKVAVIEMGAGQPGDIDYLARLVRPVIGLITHIGPAHLERMHDLTGVAVTKSELFARLPTSGLAIFPAAVDKSEILRNAADCEICMVGKQSSDIDQDRSLAVNWWYTPEQQQTRFITASERISACLQVPGEHNRHNAALVVAAAVALGIPAAAIRQGLEAYTGFAGRLQRRQGVHDCIVLDDTYNANPASLKAAISVLCDDFAEHSHWLAMGDMGELGDGTFGLHHSVGEYAREAGVNKLLACGSLTLETVKAFGEGAEHFTTQGELIETLLEQLNQHIVLLVKGSRTASMETVVEAICPATTTDLREAC